MLRGPKNKKKLWGDLTPARRVEMDLLVEEVRKKLHYQKPPLDLTQVEIHIPEIQIAEISQCPVASEIVYLDRIRRIAQVNLRQEDSKAGKTLAVCHALGHYFLHGGEEFGCRLDFFGELSGKEAEATYFAESLLMPNQLLRQMFQKMADDYDPIYKLAKCFAVKRQVIEERLMALNLL